MNLIYILGRGHSGTTMLDLVIGHVFHMRSCGELISGLSRYPSQKCTCETEMENCETWKPSFEALGGGVDRAEIFRYLSSQASIFKLPSALFCNFSPVYREALNKEAAFINAAQGSFNGVVDSSKELARGLALAVGPSKAVWLHIYRRPEQIAASYRFRAEKGKVKIYRKLFSIPTPLLFLLDVFVAISWSIWTLLTVLLGIVFPKRYICINYESFISEPDKHLFILGGELGLNVSLSEIQERLKAPFSVDHIVGGNRMSKEKEFSLKGASSTTRSIPFITKFICLFFCFPVRMVAYIAYIKTFKARLSVK